MRRLTWIDTEGGLADAVAEARTHDCVALDAEMDSYFSYYTKLCLVQMTVGEHDFLIDSLALSDLSPLNLVTEDPEIRKVFHAAENDVPYFRGHGVEFRNIFDTHLAARLLELDSKSLGGLVEIYFDVSLPKDQQRADWRIRPLPEEQVEYARQDTIYLCRLADILDRELKAQEVDEEAKHIFAALEGLELREKPFDPEGWARIKGAKELSGVQRAVMHELFAWRERVAEQEDLALFRVAHNGALLSLARKRFTDPKQLSGWAKSRTFREHAETLVEIMKKGRDNGPIPFPDTGKKFTANWSAEDEKAFEKLRTWRNEESKRLGVEPSRVFSNRQLKSVVRKRPREVKELAGIKGVDGYKLEQFGEALLEQLKSALER